MGFRAGLLATFLAVGLLGCGGGESNSGAPGTAARALSQTPTTAQAATDTGAQTTAPAQMSTEDFCGNREVSAAVDSVIGGSASCKSGPTTGLRRSAGHGIITEWTLNPVGVSVTVEHYVGNAYKSLGLTNPATYQGTAVSVNGEQCVYLSIGELVCLPGGPTRIDVLSGSSQVSSVSQYETVARAVIAALAR